MGDPYACTSSAAKGCDEIRMPTVAGCSAIRSGVTKSVGASSLRGTTIVSGPGRYASMSLRARVSMDRYVSACVIDEKSALTGWDRGRFLTLKSAASACGRVRSQAMP